jgi:TolB-like protein/AraC-like DNA-binding protein/Tfp pilus assembly protein PilF
MNKSVAVLPFRNLSTNKEAEYFVDGMTDEVLNALSKVDGLRVLSRTTSFYYKTAEESITEIGDRLNVSIIVCGSIRFSENNTRISIQIIETNDGFILWSDTFDRNLDNIFDIQDEVSLLIADRLREHLGHLSFDDRLIDHYKISLTNHKKYLKAKYHLMKLDRDNSLLSVSLFKEIIDEEPDFPLPYLNINQAYTYLGTMGLLPTEDSFKLAQPYISKALKSFSHLPESQLNLAWMECWQNWDLAKAHKHIDNALLQKYNDEYLLTKANILTVENKLNQAFIYIDKALEIAPFSAINIHYKGFLYYLRKDFSKAIPYFKKSLLIDPQLPFPVTYLGFCYYLQGDIQKGMQYFNNLPDTKDDFIAKLGGTTIGHILLQNKTEAQKGIKQLELLLESPSTGNAINFLVLCHLQNNENDLANKYIRFGFEMHIPLMLLLRNEPLAKGIEQNVIYNELVKKHLSLPKKERAKEKSKGIIFTKEELNKYKNRVTQTLETDKIYLNPDLTLRLLAEYTNLPPNYLSKLLNVGFKQNFSEIINTYRLNHFINLLKQNRASKFTFLSLAYDSGFNSKTVFNTFFKQKMKMTPKQYLQSIEKSSD